MHHPKHYIQRVKDREAWDSTYTSAHDIANGTTPDGKRNSHLWCYSDDAILEVEKWIKLERFDVNPDVRSFTSFEELYDHVSAGIGTITGVGPVEIYDVSLYLGERMTPKVVPMADVYVHGKLVESARHYLNHIGASVPPEKDLHKIPAASFGNVYDEIHDKQYAARAIEEWLCCEHDKIMRL